jgi:microcompartment protein CcmL/EutN
LPDGKEEHNMKRTALGALELNSVARGIVAGDAMLKAAQVELVRAMPTCPGKYLVIVTGAVAEVRSAVAAGRAQAGDNYVDELVIADVHQDVFPALAACTNVPVVGAVGVIETFSMAGAVMAADTACDTAAVRLIEVRLGSGLAGKAFVILTGEVAAVRSAVDAGAKAVKGQDLLLNTAVIPAPHPDLIKFLA